MVALGPSGLFGAKKAVEEEKVEERWAEIIKSYSDETKTFPRNQDGKSVFTGSSISQLLKTCRWLKRTSYFLTISIWPLDS